MKNNILWIRNDLRFDDNTALIKAVESSYEEKISLSIVFHINTEQLVRGTYSNDYFFSALNIFYKNLKNMGADLLFLYGDIEKAFNEFFLKNKNINKVFFNISERGYGLERDEKVISIFKKNGAKVCKFFDKHLHSANSLLNGKGSDYKVFTSYYNKWTTLDKEKILKFDKDKFKDIVNNDFLNIYKSEYEEILNSRKNNFESICGEDKAFEELYAFIDKNLEKYENLRDNIFLDANSSMSKYLATGQISVRRVYYAALEKGYNKGSECFIKQLAWRDFYNMVYHNNPKQENQEIIEKYRSINWNCDKYAFNIWKYGLTGFPIVDAAMRELIKTGKMHNRLRMITASFLVKDLLVDWRMGEAYFKEALIDYDSASNIGSWQWVASTGTDACPYFRIFNPSSQSKRFDPKALYIKSVIKELSDFELKHIHEPHKIKNLDIDYPAPIVDHKVQRLKVLDMYKNAGNYSSDFKNEFIKRYILFEFSKIKNSSKEELENFHSINKYLYFTYSIEQNSILEKILSREMDYLKMYAEYKIVLSKLLNIKPKLSEILSAYDHMYEYFKKMLTDNEKNEYTNIVFKCTQLYEFDDLDIKKFFIKLSYKYEDLNIKNQTLLTL